MTIGHWVAIKFLVNIETSMKFTLLLSRYFGNLYNDHSFPKMPQSLTVHDM